VTKILIVEDHRETAATLTIWLEYADYKVVVAYDGNEALALLSAEEPDLVITDGNLPGLGGIDLIKSIRAGQTPQHHIPIIMLTGYAAELADQGFEAGADRVFSKPTGPHIIVANVKNLLHPQPPSK